MSSLSKIASCLLPLGLVLASAGCAGTTVDADEQRDETTSATQEALVGPGDLDVESAYLACAGVTPLDLLWPYCESLYGYGADYEYGFPGGRGGHGGYGGYGGHGGHGGDHGGGHFGGGPGGPGGGRPGGGPGGNGPGHGGPPGGGGPGGGRPGGGPGGPGGGIPGGGRPGGGGGHGH